MWNIFNKKKELNHEENKKYASKSVILVLGTDFKFTYEIFIEWLNKGFLGFSTEDVATVDYGRKKKLVNLKNINFNNGFVLEDEERGYTLMFVKPSDTFPFKVCWKYQSYEEINFTHLELMLNEITFYNCYVYDDDDEMWQSEKSINNYKVENRSTEGLQIINVDGEKEVDISTNPGRFFKEREFEFVAAPLMYFGELSKNLFTELESEWGDSSFIKKKFYPPECSIMEARKGQERILEQYSIQEKYQKLCNRNYEEIIVDIKDLADDDIEESIELD